MPSALMSDDLNTQKPKPLDIFIVAEQFRFAGKLATLVTHHPSLKISQLSFAHDQNLPLRPWFVLHSHWNFILSASLGWKRNHISRVVI